MTTNQHPERRPTPEFVREMLALEFTPPWDDVEDVFHAYLGLFEQYEGMKARYDSYEPGTMKGQVRAIWDLAEHYGHPLVSSKHPVGFLQRYIEGLQEQLEAERQFADKFQDEVRELQEQLEALEEERREAVATAARAMQRSHELDERLGVAYRALYGNGHRPPGTPSFHMDDCSGCAALIDASLPTKEPDA